MKEMIISALIQGGFSVIAAIVGAVTATLIGAGVITRKFSSSGFQLYKNNRKLTRRLIKNATHDVTIILAVGDVFFNEYEEVLARKMKAGIKVNVLILTKDKWLTHSNYIKFDGDAIVDYEKTISILTRLKNAEAGKMLEVREFDDMMTASYIGIDLCKASRSIWRRSNPIIHMMLYQYGTMTEDSTIAYLTLRKTLEQFEITEESIEKMWNDGKRMDCKWNGDSIMQGTTDGI